MRASEARQLVQAASVNMDAKNEAQYNEIMRDIQEEINKSLSFEMWYYKPISAPLMKRLQQDGYAVTNHTDQRDGTMYKISWKNTSEGIHITH